MENIIEIIKLEKTYENFYLNITELNIREGSITGIIGKNGAGKTTLIKCILNIINYTKKQYLFNKSEIDKYDSDFRVDIGYVGDSFDAYQKIKLSDITNFYKSMYRDTWDESKYNTLLDLFELDTNKKVCELSKGMKIKYQFALVLSRQTKLLLLDEPTSGLDPIIREEILEILKRENKLYNTTILFSSHITEDIERIATDIIFIDKGECILMDCLNSVKSRFKTTSIEIKNEISATSILKHNDYYIVDTNEIDNMALYNFKDASLSQILIYLRGDNNEESNN